MKEDLMKLVKGRVLEYYKKDTLLFLEDIYDGNALATDTVYKNILRAAFHARQLPNFYDARDSAATANKGGCMHGLGDGCVHNKDTASKDSK